MLIASVPTLDSPSARPDVGEDLGRHTCRVQGAVGVAELKAGVEFVVLVLDRRSSRAGATCTGPEHG